MTNIESTNNYYQQYTTKTSTNTATVAKSIYSIPTPQTPKSFSEEQLEELAGALENILQDAMVECVEECCDDPSKKPNITDLSRLIVSTLIDTLPLPAGEKEDLLLQIKGLTKQLTQLKQATKIDQYKEDKHKSSYYDPHNPYKEHFKDKK